MNMTRTKERKEEKRKERNEKKAPSYTLCDFFRGKKEKGRRKEKEG